MYKLLVSIIVITKIQFSGGAFDYKYLQLLGTFGVICTTLSIQLWLVVSGFKLKNFNN